MNEYKCCQNCANSHSMCGMLICRLHEAYVPSMWKCSWWVKEAKDEDDE